MYLPAIPALCTLWGVPLTQANLTLAAFFISFSTFLLVHGPLADQCGKRPVLIGGISTYILGSLLCAGAGSITWLILARVAQAFGAAAAAAMSLALAKDLYSGDARKKLLAYIGVLIPLCPMIAPTIGAFMLEYVSWRGIFLFQAFLALPTLYGSFRLQDPTPRGESGGLAVALKRYATLMRNKNYMVYVLAFSLVNLAFFAFVGGSSDIYIRGFGLSESRFGLFFAFNALGAHARVAVVLTLVRQHGLAGHSVHLLQLHARQLRCSALHSGDDPHTFCAAHVLLFAVYGHEPPHQ